MNLNEAQEYRSEHTEFRSVKLAELKPRIGEFATMLLGEPNKERSTKNDLRFGSNGSVSVIVAGPKIGSYFNHETKMSGGLFELIQFEGKTFPTEWLRNNFGMEIEQQKSFKERIEAIYDYRNENGELEFQVVRLEGKDFRQRKPKSNGDWEWRTGDRQILYRLPELIAAPQDALIVAAEGEKDADNVAAKLGFVATCNPGGAVKKGKGKDHKSKWREEYNSYFIGRDVAIPADNDDAGRDHANDVARNLARVARRVRIVELPGLPPKGDISDWITAGGTREQFEQLVDASPEFQLDELEIENNTKEASEIEQIQRHYPLPEMDKKIFYKRTQTGEIWAHKEIEKKDGTEILPFSSPFTINARLRRVGGKRDAYSLRVVFQNRDGKPGEADIECGALAAVSGRNVMVELLDAGLRTDNRGDQEVIQILKAFNPPSEVLVVQQPGWFFDMPGCPDPVFVAPCGTVFGAPEAVRIELDASIRLRPDIARAGTLEGWQNAIRTAITAKDVPHWTLGACANFAGVILSLIRMASCGVNVSGHTSGGKTLTQEIAASGWSTPDKHRPGSLLQMANNTENSIELAAKRATATALNLDELRLVSGKILAGWIYMLAGGAGKKRMTVNVTMLETIVWSVFVLMSSEHSLADKIRGDGVEYDPGMSVRIVDINIDDFNRSVDAETLNAINGIHRNYGHAGIAFVRKLVERGDHRRASDIHKSILQLADKLAGDGSDPAMKRAAIPFALLTISGSMAKEFGIIPAETDVRDAIKVLWDRFKQSAEAEVLEPETLMVRNLASWVARGWDVTVKSVTEQTGVNNRDTWAWYDENAVYIPKDRIQAASGNAMKESRIGATLNRMELLADQAPDRFYVRFVPQTGRVDAYALKRERFGRSKHDRDIDGIDDVIPDTSDRAAEPKPMSLRQLAQAGRLELRRQGDRLWADIDRGRHANITISQTALAALKALGVPETQVTWPPVANEATGND